MFAQILTHSEPHIHTPTHTNTCAAHAGVERTSGAEQLANAAKMGFRINALLWGHHAAGGWFPSKINTKFSSVTFGKYLRCTGDGSELRNTRCGVCVRERVYNQQQQKHAYRFAPNTRTECGMVRSASLSNGVGGWDTDGGGYGGGWHWGVSSWCNGPTDEAAARIVFAEPRRY